VHASLSTHGGSRGLGHQQWHLPYCGLHTYIYYIYEIINEDSYKVLIGDPFGGYETVEDGLSLKDAEKLSLFIQEECDYFKTTTVKPSTVNIEPIKIN
jgi:hypothetical protein